MEFNITIKNLKKNIELKLNRESTSCQEVIRKLKEKYDKKSYHIVNYYDEEKNSGEIFFLSGKDFSTVFEIIIKRITNEEEESDALSIQ